MSLINVEIKAKSKKNAEIRKLLEERNADFKGKDHQIDTYFKVNNGRLKLREGSIENNLIHYNRQNQKGPKQADIILYKPEPKSTLKELLVAALGVLTIVDKQREIYFIENVKFHLDQVKNLGTFMEIEAIDRDGSIGREKLLDQCEHYMKMFGISEHNLVSNSYSDMILNKN